MDRTCPVCNTDVGRTATEFLFKVQMAICPHCKSELISVCDYNAFMWHCWNRKPVPEKEK